MGYLWKPTVINTAVKRRQPQQPSVCVVSASKWRHNTKPFVDFSAKWKQNCQGNLADYEKMEDARPNMLIKKETFSDQ